MTGSGTLLDPYIIYDVTDLQAMENDLTAYYELANDIDASATVGWNAGAGFAPVGDSFTPFAGSFDGKGFEVSGLFIDRPATDCVSLFGGTSAAAALQDVGVVSCDITGRDMTGALVGNNYASIQDCHSTGSITGGGCTGGLIGQNYGAMTRCYSYCTITGVSTAGCTDEGFGGLIGSNAGAAATITQCFATGNVTVDAAVQMTVGGLCGSTRGDLTNCYARGDVSGFQYIGGLFGWVTSQTIVTTNCYSTGNVTGNAYLGGLIAWNWTATAVDCFWDTETSGQVTSDGGTGKTTAQMKTDTTFTDAGWDFATIWTICSGVNNDYPCLVGVTPSCSYAPVIPYAINKAYALAREEL